MTSSTATRPRPVRWVIALLVTIAMLVATSGIVAFAGSGSSGGPGFAPADSVLWAELRLDLPGDQQEQLSELLGHLPGFADPAALDTKINELLDQVVSQASNGGASWTGDIDPWSNRELGIALLDLPASTSATPVASPNTLGLDPQAGTGQVPPSMVIGLGVKDRAALESRLASFLTQQPVSTEAYAGESVTTVGDVSYAVTESYLLISPSADDIKASLDVLAGTAPGLAQDPAFVAAAAQIPSDRLAAFYFALSAIRPLLESQLSGQPGTVMALDMLDQLPAWVSGYAQASSDHLTLAIGLQAPASLPVPAMRETDLVSHFPSDTFLYLEVRDLGATLHRVLEPLLARIPANDAQNLAQVEQLLGAPLPAFLDPVQDAALGVGFANGVLQGGIAATLSDPATAQTRAASLLALIRLSAAGSDAPFTVSQADVSGTTVTTFTFAEDGMTAFAAPIPTSVSVAVAGDHLYLGLGDFVANALTQDATSSLASDPRFVTAVSTAGTPNSGMAFLDIAGIQGVIESMAAADPGYTTDVKPWLDALDYLVVSSTTKDDTITAKVLLFVR
jgi:hypothetical protein